MSRFWSGVLVGAIAMFIVAASFRSFPCHAGVGFGNYAYVVCR